MKYHYRVLVKLDDRVASQSALDKYFEFIEKYKGSAVGHERTGNSEVCFYSEKKLARKDLETELGEEIPIIEIKETKMLTKP